MQDESDIGIKCYNLLIRVLLRSNNWRERHCSRQPILFDATPSAQVLLQLLPGRLLLGLNKGRRRYTWYHVYDSLPRDRLYRYLCYCRNLAALKLFNKLINSVNVDFDGIKPAQLDIVTCIRP